MDGRDRAHPSCDSRMRTIRKSRSLTRSSHVHRIGVGRLDGRVKSADGNKTLPTIRATITALHHSPESATAGLNVHVARRAGRAEVKLDAQMLGSYSDRLPRSQLSHTRGRSSSISIDSFLT